MPLYIAVGPLTSSTYFFSQKMLGDELRAIAIIVLVTLQTIFFTPFFPLSYYRCQVVRKIQLVLLFIGLLKIKDW